MHSRNDNVFPYHNHVMFFEQVIKNLYGYFWAVNGMFHTKINLHNDWLKKVNFFIDEFIEKS